MKPRRILAVAAIGLCAVLWTYACGDGTTEPSTPPPDPPRPATVAVAPATVQLTALGATEQLTAEVRDQSGNVMTGVAVSWGSNAAAVATVNSSGLVTAVANGTATVTATAGSVSGTATVTVAQQVGAVTVTPAADTLVAFGDTLRLSAEATDANGHAVAGAVFAWASGDRLVAVVDDAGLVTGVGAGETGVTATAGGVTGRAALTVVAPVPTTVAVTPDTVSLTALGQTAQLAAEVEDQVGRVMDGVRVSWSSADTAVAAVDSAGLVTAGGNGTATITATAGTASASAAVVVAQVVSAVAVSAATNTVLLGDTLRLAAEAADANGHAVAGAVFAWASGDTLVAVVDDAGLVTGVGAGETEVTATAAGVTGRAALTVVAPATVAVTPDTVSLTALGQTAQLAAVVRDQFGRVMDGVRVYWSSVDTTVAAVDSAGLVTAISAGATTIAATAGMAYGTAAVTVMQSIDLVVVSPAADTIPRGDTLRLVAEALDANGHRVDGAVFGWSSSDVSVASVDAAGLVTGVGEGTATITAAAGSARGTAGITVQNPQRFALVALYNATDGPNWVNNTNWLTDAPLDEWHGVRTDPTTGRVLELSLFRNGLRGEIPRELIGLSNLKRLLLSQNNLTGPIPAGLKTLAHLTHLELGSNQLTGEIPSELGDLSHLSFLWLNRNNLSGSIPPELGNLRNLKVLLLEGNELTGSIPADLGGMTNLLGLRLERNRLEGVIPKTFLGLEHLGSLSFSENRGLCAPGTPAFVEWSRDVERRPTHGRIRSHYAGPFCSESDRIVLERLFETAGGANWTHSDMWLATDVLAEWYGVSADSLGRVRMLNLTGNGLAGRLPADLGKLAHMVEMRIAGNEGLSGRLPLSLAQLSLHTLDYADTGLCAPVSARFREWLSSIQSHNGTNECPPLSDRDVLEALYHATGGPSWTNNDQWLTNAPLAEWYGVRSSAQDEVWALQMRENNLEGEIPAELGDLASLQELNLTINNLRGEIPAELGYLASLQVLLLEANDLTGSIPPELGNLANLTRMRLGGNSLAGAIPPELGHLVNLWELNTWGNDLSGSIPPELGRLARLRYLSLPGNDLTGPIPPELGQLGDLQVLYLVDNDLSGSIPPELRELGSLERLYLAENDLAGPIPRELGSLGNLQHMVLAANNLSGPIPPELGELRSLQYLHLVDNQLAGPIPGDLGNLSTVETLSLASNNLSGSVPPAFGRMSSLKQLSLTNNPAMRGPLPLELTALHQLEALLAGDTDLCAPSDAGFTAWLQRVHKTRISPCIQGDPAAAYLTQAVQSREFPVPLVAGKRALLRVFVTANSATGEGIPLVRTRFYHDGREVYVADIPAKSDPIPAEVDERSMSKSANAEIPDWVIVPGLEMVIDVDPEGTLDPALGVTKRIPAEDRVAVDVRAMPLLDLTLIPFIWSETHDSSIVNLVGAMAATPESHEMLWDTRTLLPISDLRVTAHEPVLSASNSAFTLLAQTEAIRTMEGGAGHYMGMMSSPVTGAAGVAAYPGRWSFSVPAADVMAHELGHNMNLLHAPCGAVGATSDPSYPYPNGTIGVLGYDFRDGGRLVQPSTPDLMSYCHPRWIGDYGFTNALRYRLFDEGAPTGAAATAATRSLLVWGGLGADSGLYLEPAFVVDAPAAAPDSSGAHMITGRTANGGELFSLSFAMPETADGDGSSSFAFTLPVQPGWATNLANITLTGPGGSAILDADTDKPMVILRNPRTGQVRGILRDLPPPTQAVADAVGEAAGQRLEILFSRGIPGAEAWPP